MASSSQDRQNFVRDAGKVLKQLILQTMPRRVSGLQHFPNIIWLATFRPTECLISLALSLLRAVLRDEYRTRPWSLHDASWGDGAVLSPRSRYLNPSARDRGLLEDSF
jgi:hypothetical protein